MPAAAKTINASRSRERIRISESQPLGGRFTYDAAKTNDDNRKHWQFADHLSANAAHDPTVRAILRSRSRYEYANNSYCRGMLLTSANDVIGTGPRLQVIELPDWLSRAGVEPDVLEQRFNRWLRRIRIGEKLRCAMLAKMRDGEVFLMRVTNRGLRGAVQLDLRLIECDQVTTPDLRLFRDDEQVTDGIVFDDDGNPAFYHVLKVHPGETGFMGIVGGALAEYDSIAAANIRHWFRPDRPGQTRGVPETTPALPLFAQLRRYTLAVIAAAETAADVAGVIKSTAPPQNSPDVEPFDAVEFMRRMFITMPEGWDISQLKAEQPATTYDMFKREIINEIARCLNQPFNIAAANSSNYNYASGRLDHQVYWRNNEIVRNDLELLVMEWLLESWLAEATRIADYLAPRFEADILDFVDDPLEGFELEWHWDGVYHVDPLKEAQAEAVRLNNRSTNFARSYGSRGMDWQNELRQTARELAFIKQLEGEFGVSMTPATQTAAPAAGDESAVDEEGAEGGDEA